MSSFLRLASRISLCLALLGLVFFAPAAEARAPRSAELVADAQTGKILYGSNIQSLRHPASLTKIMTLYLVFAALEQNKLQLDDYVPVSAYAASMPPSRLGLEPGSSIRVRDVIYGLVTESANDASVVIAEAVGGSESRFAQMMTQQARALGMKRTTYRNANGLHNPQQVTTAFDQAILARAMLYHFPKQYAYFKTRSFTFDGRAHRNHNNLMARYEGMDGIKTGFIRQSGFNLVASALREDKRLIGVVFGGRSARSRDDRMAVILDNGFRRAFADNSTSSGTTYAGVPVIRNTADAGDVTSDANATPVAANDIAQGDDDGNAAANSPTETAKASDLKSSTLKATWAVQIGTYKSRTLGITAANAAKKRAPTYLKNASASISAAKSGKKTMYRARLQGLSEKQARAACDSLSKAGQDCLTLPPRG
jgi:D-alanyl-D-alanine carboxypeptidase